MDGDALVAALDAVVLMQVVSRAERGIVKAFESEGFAQVLFERVQRSELAGQCGRLPRIADPPELLNPPSTSSAISPQISQPARSIRD